MSEEPESKPKMGRPPTDDPRGAKVTEGVSLYRDQWDWLMAEGGHNGRSRLARLAVDLLRVVGVHEGAKLLSSLGDPQGPVEEGPGG